MKITTVSMKPEFIVLQPSVPPDRVLDWAQILQEGLTALPARGLYVVVRGVEVLYVGRSRVLPQRVGELIGSLLSGRGNHAAGAVMCTAGVVAGDLRLVFYFGAEAYRREPEVVVALRPRFNTKYRRDTRGRWHTSAPPAPPGMSPAAQLLVEVLGRNPRKEPHPAVQDEPRDAYEILERILGG